MVEGMATARNGFIPLLLLGGLIVQTVFVAALAALLFRGLLRPEVRTYLSEA